VSLNVNCVIRLYTVTIYTASRAWRCWASRIAFGLLGRPFRSQAVLVAWLLANRAFRSARFRFRVAELGPRSMPCGAVRLHLCAGTMPLYSVLAREKISVADDGQHVSR